METEAAKKWPGNWQFLKTRYSDVSTCNSWWLIIIIISLVGLKIYVLRIQRKMLCFTSYQLLISHKR